jgi:hypothetical protein
MTFRSVMRKRAIEARIEIPASNWQTARRAFARRGERFVTPAPTARTGGQILVDQLVAQGVERLYCVPGESYSSPPSRARASGLPAILHVKVDPEAITPSTTLTAIRETALKRSYAP